MPRGVVPTLVNSLAVDWHKVKPGDESADSLKRAKRASDAVLF